MNIPRKRRYPRRPIIQTYPGRDWHIEVDDTIGLVFDDQTTGDERTAVLILLREMRDLYANAPGVYMLDEAIAAIERGEHHARGSTAKTTPCEIPRITFDALAYDEREGDR